MNDEDAMTRSNDQKKRYMEADISLDHISLQLPFERASPCSIAVRELTKASYTSTNANSYTVKTSKLHVDLVVEQSTFKNSFVQFETRSYGGSFPSPTIRVCPGDLLTIQIYNMLSAHADDPATSVNRTNIYLHGMDIPPEQYSAPSSVEPGNMKIYVFDIPVNHPRGTFWYHPHVHGLTNSQISGMMGGALIVEDLPLKKTDTLEEEAIEMQKEIQDVLSNVEDNFDVNTKETLSSEEIPNDDIFSFINVNSQGAGHFEAGSDEDPSNLLNNDDVLSGGEATVSDMEEIVMLLQGLCFHNCPNDFDNLENALTNKNLQGIETDDVGSGFRPNITLLPGAHFPLHSPSLLHVLVNGQYNPIISIHPEEYKRLRLINAIANSIIELEVSAGCSLTLMARDGLYRETLRNLPILVIPPGGRADVALQCLHRGTFALSVNRDVGMDAVLGPQNQYRVPSQRLVAIQVMGSDLHMILPSRLPSLPAYYTASDIAAEHVPLERQYNYEMTIHQNVQTKVISYGINHQQFLGNGQDISNHTMEIDRVQEWTISAHSYGLLLCGPNTIQCHNMNNPFHMHSTHFQIVKISNHDAHSGGVVDTGHDLMYEIGEWRDSIPLFGDEVTIRFVPRFDGDIMSQCNAAGMSDMGMAQLSDVVDGPHVFSSSRQSAVRTLADVLFFSLMGACAIMAALIVKTSGKRPKRSVAPEKMKIISKGINNHSDNVEAEDDEEERWIGSSSNENSMNGIRSDLTSNPAAAPQEIQVEPSSPRRLTVLPSIEIV